MEPRLYTKLLLKWKHVLNGRISKFCCCIITRQQFFPFNSSPEAHKVSKSNDFTKNSLLNNSSGIAMNPETD